MDWSDVSKNFGLCQHTDCPRGAECLRQTAAALMPTGLQQWFYVTPWATEGYAQGRCRAYVSSAPTRVALGFRRALGTVPAANLQAVREAFMTHYGTSQRDYYRARSGVRPLTPEQQEEIAALLVEHGATEPVAFDAYDERIVFPY